MSVNVTINGVTYAQPNQGTPPPWGDIQADIIVALVNSVLQKSGGTFTLTAETYFGATYGLKSQYYKGPTANPSSAGVLRLAVSEGMGWRNNANDGDLLLTVNGSNALLFNGVQLAVGTGDVAGPGSSTDNAIARFDSTTGKIIQNSGVIVDDSNNITGVASLTAATATIGGVAFTDKTTGAASSTDNALARFDSTTGKIIQNSGVIIDDSNNVTGVASLTASTATIGGVAFTDKATGAASSTDNAIPRYDGTGGKTLQGSSVIVDDSNNISSSGNKIELTGSNLATASVPTADTIYPNSMCKGWAFLTCGAAGAVTINQGFNIASASYSGLSLTVTLHTALANTEAAIVGNISTGTAIFVADEMSGTSTVILKQWDFAGLVQNWGTGDKVQFVIFGMQ